MLWPEPPRILSEQLHAPPEPLALLLRAGPDAPAAAVCARAARAVLDLPPVESFQAPPWLAPHQVPAVRRLLGILETYGGALLADAVGLGKSYVALAVAQMRAEPFGLIVPAVLTSQWRDLLARLHLDCPILSHETLSHRSIGPSDCPSVRLWLVDEAHRFRNPATKRYHHLARLVVGTRTLLVTATPVHNRIADLFHLFRLFLRDHSLTGLGVPSLRLAALGQVPDHTLVTVSARLSVARSRVRVDRGYGSGPLALAFPSRSPGQVIRAPAVPLADLSQLVAGIRRIEL